MARTPFAGFEQLAPGAALSTDGYAFQYENPSIADALAKLGCVTHKHDAHAAMVNPTSAATVTALATGGAIPASTAIHACYTLLDGSGGETLPTTPIVVTTAAGYATPGLPSGTVSYSAGVLLAGTPLYAVTVTDGSGGETALGPSLAVTINPGHANAEVNFTGLTALTNAASGSSSTAGWRLWRSVDGGSTWNLMATGAHSVNTHTDDGTTGGDCTVNPPNSGTTVGTSSLTVVVPSSGQPAAATFFNVYADPTGQFLTPCRLGTYPIADFDATITYTALTVLSGAPPAVSRCYPGANKIDPATDLLNFHWQAPVSASSALASGTQGDVRMAVDTGHLWGVLGVAASIPSDWTDLTGGGGGGASDPLGSALGVKRVLGPTAVALPGSTTTSVTITVPSWAEVSISRLVLAVRISHPDVSQTAARLIDPATDPAEVWVATSFSGTHLGLPSGTAADPDNLLYFSDFALGQVNYSGDWNATPTADAGVHPPVTGVVRPHQGFTSYLLGDDIAGNWTFEFTNSDSSAGTLEEIVLYFISEEFDALMPTPAPPPKTTDWIFTGDGSTTVFIAATTDSLGEYSSVSLWQEVLATVGGTYVYATEVAASAYDVARVRALDSSGPGVRITMHTAPTLAAQYTVHVSP